MPAQTTPLNITRPGAYVLTRDITVPSGDAITISANGVTLDLNGRNISVGTPGTGRGIFINGVSGVSVKNGKVGAFNVNVQADNSSNISLSNLQIIGQNLPLAGGPSEIGILLISSRGCLIDHNLITSVGVGIFVRGPLSGGNTVSNNTVTGGPNISRSPLGLCWNPLAGAAGNPAPGPKGDRAYNNHISQFVDGFSFSSGTTGSFAFDNTISYTNVGFRPDSTVGGNILQDNITLQVAPNP
ncbi:MAG: right-handed parallel beta-helix repeat-containing protein [Akkermansiaceae bacterium]|nr:right-handed parallel beta-helix repeat-containing protein [Armatimonadota bacterium]